LVKTYSTDLEALDALRFQHRLSDHLSNHGLPVAWIARTKEGKGIVELGDWALELQKFVDGEPMRITSSSLAIAAKALGTFHDVCRDFPRPKREARMWRFSEVPRSSFAELYNAARAEGNTQVLTDQCNAISLFLRDAAAALDWEARGEFETGLIHGDWHGGNLLFKDGKLVAVLDLEFAGEGCFLEDLSYAISNLCVRTTDDPELLTKRSNQFLDNYQLCRTLSYAEEVALYYAVGVKHVTTVCYQIQQFGGHVAGHAPSEWMRLLAAQCTWLGERARKARWRT
ncbi:MAG TPA: hypothetical protein ENN80_09215, partial [Candidatus Hydrogenedentes bacterium]|nr:hypothetical protein [Candidatus Hydrogenedentota bacterium]